MSGIKYNVTGQRTQINYGNGTGTSYEYDERNHRLKRLETRNAKSILQTIEYEYDDTGNVTERESEMLGTDGRMKHALHEYEYDSSGRLTEGSGKVEKTTAGILRPNIVSYKSKYSYDAIGNILTKTQAVNGGESSLSCNDTYTYGGKQPHAVTKAGAMVFTYDDNGNMIKRENTETKNTMTLVWDDENRLIKTTDSLHTTDYRYDANGERIIKKSELGETQYVSANYIVRNKTVISKHIFAGNQRVASTVSMKDNCGTVSEKNTMYFHPDHLGSSSYVTDKKGNFFEMIEYLPYGETLYDEAATVDKTEFRFTSKEQDAETGLYYHGARYRDAKTGVWLSVDPILEEYMPIAGYSDEARRQNRKLPGMGGVYNPTNLNLYHYAGNNPIKYYDPDGKQSACAAWSGTMWWLLVVDGPIPVGDIVYVAGVAGTGCFDLWVRFGPVLMANADKIPAVVDKTQNTINSISNSSSNMPDPNKFDISKLKSQMSELSKNNIKHINKHVSDFQKFDKNMNLEKLIELGEKITKIENYIGSPGGRANFQATVNIGGKNVNVRAVYDTANKLQTVFIKK